MNQVTQILQRIEAGDGTVSNELFTLVYDELRQLARSRLAHERKDHTLQATALVNEAYLRLVGNHDSAWENRRHFFSAASEAMWRILIESARRKQATKRGGDRERLDAECIDHAATQNPKKFLALNEALELFAEQEPDKAELVKLRFFAGMTNAEAAAALQISAATADRYWAYARAWLQVEMSED